MSSRAIILRVCAALCIGAVLAILFFSEEPEATIDDVEDEPQFNMEVADSAVVSAERVPLYRFDTSGRALVADTSVVAGVPCPQRGGRKVAISVCGVDSRMGENVEHADANHVLVLWLDSGIVDVLSIPRGTSADAGASRAALNILANVRAYRGRDAYLREVASIAGLDTIDYYVDFGFSQARGLLDLLGFGSGSGKALKVLRSRQAFATGDYQRSYNQGQFIRQTLLRRFASADGFTGGLVLRAGLALVNTNLTMDNVNNLVAELRKRDFPKHNSSVQVFLRPDYHAKMAVYDFADSTVLGSLLGRIESYAQSRVAPSGGDSAMTAFRSAVSELISRAAADTSSRPQRALALLRRPFAQRVWWQFDDTAERSRIRSAMAALLAHSYRKSGNAVLADKVMQVVQAEEQ